MTTPVAEPGPLIAMKLQAVMDRPAEKQGTDLLDIVRLVFDEATRPAALAQLGEVDSAIGRDIALHVERWFVNHQALSLRRIHDVEGADVTTDDLDLVAELLADAVQRKDG